jgi:molybdopterin-guanine dinucleotide biosynthesis protein A
LRMSDCAALILAGGESRRIGGVNKPSILLGGKPLIRHVVDRVGGVVGKIVIVIEKDGNPSEYRPLLPNHVQIKCDEISGRGPVAGLVSGINGLAEYVIVLACDTPFVNPDVLRYLFKRVEDVGADLAIPQWPNSYIEPLQAVYRTAPALRGAEKALERGECKIADLIQQLRNVLYVPVDELRVYDPSLLTFFNINTAEDLEKAKNLVGEDKTINGDRQPYRPLRPPWC